MLDALHDSPIRLVSLPARGGRGEHGRGVREADRPARDLPRHARPGRDARERRRPHRVAGLDAACCCSSARCRGTCAGATPSRSSTTPPSSGRRRSGRSEAGDAGLIPELVARAFATAVAGPARPGRARAPRGRARRRDRRAGRRPRRRRSRGPAPDDLARLRELLAAREPAGRDRRRGRLDGGDRRATCVAFAEASELPVAASFRCQDYVDNRSRVYAGHLTLGADPALLRRVREADLLLAVGGRLGDITTQGYTLVRDQPLVHVHPDRGEPGRVHRTALPIVAALPAFAAAARALEPGRRRAPARVDGGGAGGLPRQPPPRRRARAPSTSAP